MNIGEAARSRLFELAKEMHTDPYEGGISVGDLHLLDEIRELAGRPFSTHPLKTRDNILAGIRRSPLFEVKGYMSLPERGRGLIAIYGLKHPKDKTVK